MVLVSADDEIDAVRIEERQPFLANPEIRAVRSRGGGDRDLMHADDQPIDPRVAARGG